MSSNPSIPTPTLPANYAPELFQYMRNLTPHSWQNAFGYNPREVQQNAMYVHMPITISNSTVVHISSTIDAVSAELGDVVARLDRHDDMLQEILETVRVIEFETRRLNPDANYALTDAAEAGLNSIVQTIKDKGFPPVPPELDALLTRAVQRRAELPVEAGINDESNTEGLATR